MKKQYLIGLLGITAILIPTGTSLLNVTNSFSIEDPQTGIVINNTNSGVFVVDDGEINSGDKIDAITINATYDKTKNKNLTIDKTDSLLIYYSDTEPLELTYYEINNYKHYDDGEGFIKAVNNKGIATYSASFDSKNDKELKLGTKDPIWDHQIKDASDYKLNTTINLIGSERPTETEIGIIEIKPGLKASTINSSLEAEVLWGENSATIDYQVELGKDYAGEDVTIDDVFWVDFGVDETSEDYILGQASDNKEYENEIPAEGTITATNLKSQDKDEKYDFTAIGAEISDGSLTCYKTIKEFTTWDQQTKTELKAKKVSATTDSATLTYDISTLGKTHEGDDAIIEEVMWVTSDWTEADPDDEANILAIDDEAKNKELIAEDLTTGGNPYERTRIVAKTSDGANPESDPVYSDPEASSAQVEPFDIKYEVNNSEIKESETKVSFVGDSDGIVSYEITPGNNDAGVSSIVESVAWMDGEDTLAINENSPALEGTLETTGGKLDVNTEYDNTKLVAKMDDAKEPITAEVDSFTTPISEDQEQPELIVDTIETTSTNATINFDVNYGLDNNGIPYEIDKIIVEDENNKKYTDTTIINPIEGETTGSIIINNLDPNTEYNDWKLQTTFVGSDDKEEIETFKTYLNSFKTLKEKLEVGTIIGIIIGVIFFVGIIAWVGNILNKKYKAKKINTQTKEQVKVAIKKQEQEQKENK